MTTFSSAQKSRPQTPPIGVLADGLGLAAAPVFALMAGIAAAAGPQMAMCSAMPGLLPIDGMAWMYLLMSLFHLPSWLRFATGWLRQRNHNDTAINGE